MKKNRTYSEEFKARAVSLSFRGDNQVADVAGVLGIRRNLLSRWRREHRTKGKHCIAASSKTPQRLEAELSHLKREINSLRAMMANLRSDAAKGIADHPMVKAQIEFPWMSFH